jgi:hypothetical protein
MSSATSISRATRSADRPDAAETTRVHKDGFRPWHFFVLASLLAATVTIVMARQPAPEHLVLLSVIVAAAGLCAAALYGTLAPLVRTELDGGRVRLTERARAALEREKMLVLRSIKELEFDRAMGKVSASDFDEMAGRLRARAIALIKQIDAGGADYRGVIEQQLAERVDRAVASMSTCRCGITNDADAAFCKRCGTRLVPETAKP